MTVPVLLALGIGVMRTTKDAAKEAQRISENENASRQAATLERETSENSMREAAKEAREMTKKALMRQRSLRKLADDEVMYDSIPVEQQLEVSHMVQQTWEYDQACDLHV